MPTKKTLFMETTEVPAERTAAEISGEILKAGATQIATDYKDGQIIGLRWVMRVSGKDILFSMPARVDPVYRILCARKKIKPATPDEANYGNTDLFAKARRVAWRQLLRWVQSQLAMIETGMVAAEEVFFPYMFDARADRTMFELFKESDYKLLEAPRQ